jgi:hypothetical protein
VKNDYASVQEQSGIRAGDGGFHVTVGGNTDLKGGVISSAAGAASSSVVTATLTQSDIANHATVDASSVGISGGFKVDGDSRNALKTGTEGGSNGIFHLEEPKGATGINLPTGTAVSNKDSGTTRSGIGAGTLLITDDVSQHALTGQSAAQTATSVNRNVVSGGGTSGHVANNFDQNATNAALEITGAFNAAVAAPLAAKAANIVGDIGKAKEDAAQRSADDYSQLAAAAGQRGDTQEALALSAKAKEEQATATAWSDNGLYRLALHAATQGLIGGLAGGGGGALSGISGVAGGNLGQRLGEAQGNAEADRLGLPLGKERTDFINTFKETAATIGGTVAGLAAAGASGNGSDKLVGMMQGASTANDVDVFNRQLHDSEKKTAEKLAAASHGKYTVAEIEAAMRNSGNSALHEDVTTGMVVPLTTATSPKEIYDTTGMVLTKDGAGHSFLVQQLSTNVDPGLAAYIRDNTGGSTSPYAWFNSTLGIPAPGVATVHANPFTPNSDGCITGDCAAGILPNRNHTAGETQFLGGVQAVAGTGQAMGGGTLVVSGLGSCLETFGLGCAAAAFGGFQIFAGWDNANTGVKTAIDAKPHATAGGELLQAAGLSPVTSELLYAGLQLGTGVGGVKLGGVLNETAAAKVGTTAGTDGYVHNNFYREGEISPQPLSTSSGVIIRANPEKTTTVLGTYADDTGKIIDNQLGYPKTLNYLEPKKGGFNLLNTPDDLYNAMGADKFWKEVNEPFLQAAIDRGDEIYLATKPTVFNTRNLKNSDGLSGYGREYKYLTDRGYVYDQTTGRMCYKGCSK